MTRDEAADWLTSFFLPPMRGLGESARAESAAKFRSALIALTTMNFDSPSLLCATLPPSAAGEREAANEATLAMAVARLGGMVEGAPTARHNFLQRIDKLRAMERLYGAAMEANEQLQHDAARSRGEGVSVTIQATESQPSESKEPK